MFFRAGTQPIATSVDKRIPAYPYHGLNPPIPAATETGNFTPPAA